MARAYPAGMEAATWRTPKSSGHNRAPPTPERTTCLSLQLQRSERARERVATRNATNSFGRTRETSALSLSFSVRPRRKISKGTLFFSMSTASKARSLLGLNNSTERERDKEDERERERERDLTLCWRNRLEEMKRTGLLQFLVTP